MQCHVYAHSDEKKVATIKKKTHEASGQIKGSRMNKAFDNHSKKIEANAFVFRTMAANFNWLCECECV